MLKLKNESDIIQDWRTGGRKKRGKPGELAREAFLPLVLREVFDTDISFVAGRDSS